MKEIPSASRIFKWLIAFGVYFWIITSCSTLASFSGNYSTSNFFGVLGCLFPLMLIGGVMAGVVFAFNKDKEREHTLSDDFKENNILYRYGYSINY
jgi:hypothetical protein